MMFYWLSSVHLPRKIFDFRLQKKIENIINPTISWLFNEVFWFPLHLWKPIKNTSYLQVDLLLFRLVSFKLSMNTLLIKLLIRRFLANVKLNQILQRDARYCKQTFIPVREIFAGFVRTSSSRIFLSPWTSSCRMVIITKCGSGEGLGTNISHHEPVYRN